MWTMPITVPYFTSLSLLKWPILCTSSTLLVPPHYLTHTVHPAHPNYTTCMAHTYCANCPVLPVHAPTCSQSAQTFRACSQQVTLPLNISPYPSCSPCLHC